MSSVQTIVQASINSGPDLPAELTIEQEFTVIRSERATRPDPAWTFTDDARHFHAWSGDRDLPTLDTRSRNAPCDGSCGGVCDGEGYTVTEHFCRICGQQIEPGRLPDQGEKRIPTARHWHLLVDSDRTLAQTGEHVSVRIVRDFLGYFGVAVVTSMSMASLGNEVRVTTRLDGGSQLGDLSPFSMGMVTPPGMKGMSWVK